MFLVLFTVGCENKKCPENIPDSCLKNKIVYKEIGEIDLTIETINEEIEKAIQSKENYKIYSKALNDSNLKLMLLINTEVNTIEMYLDNFYIMPFTIENNLVAFEKGEAKIFTHYYIKNISFSNNTLYLTYFPSVFDGDLVAYGLKAGLLFKYEYAFSQQQGPFEKYINADYVKKIKMTNKDFRKID